MLKVAVFGAVWFPPHFRLGGRCRMPEYTNIAVTELEYSLAEQYRDQRFGTDAVGLRHALRDALQQAIDTEQGDSA